MKTIFNSKTTFIEKFDFKSEGVVTVVRRYFDKGKSSVIS